MGRARGRGFLAFACARSVAIAPHDAALLHRTVLRSRTHLLTVACLRHFHRGAHVYRFRWHLHLSEEAENPRRNIMLATVSTCVVIGILSAVEVYAGATDLAGIPAFSRRSKRSAYSHVAGRDWWLHCFTIVGFTLLLANFGSGMGSQLGAARLLYGMGRSNAHSKIFLWGGRQPASHSPQQRLPGGRGGLNWGLPLRDSCWIQNVFAGQFRADLGHG